MLDFVATRDGHLHVTSLNVPLLQLPPREHSDGSRASFHLGTPSFHLMLGWLLDGCPSMVVCRSVRVDPGQVVSGRAAGRPVFLFPGHDEEGHPVPGFHVIAEDRTFEVVERAQNKPVVQNGSSYIVTVAPGFFCKAFLNRSPLLLGAGQHMINLSGFSIPDPLRGTFRCLRVPHHKAGSVSVMRSNGVCERRVH